MTADTQPLELDYQPLGRNGRARLTARFPDGTSHTDVVNLADARDRERFLRALCKGRPGIDRDAVAAHLERIVADLVAQPAADDRPRGASPPDRPPADSRPRITISTDEHDVNRLAASALANDPDLYQRGNLLVRVLRDDGPAARGIRRPATPRIEVLPPALLRERLAANAQWVQPRQTSAGPVESPAHPPAWCVAAVHSRGAWPGVRHLEAVIDHPVLRPDGTVLSAPGYDADMGLLFVPRGPTAPVPERPTRADALDALARLLDLVEDFPFASAVHQSAWLAALLTPLARFAFVGPAPLFLADSNVRGTGKGLLLACIARIITGEPFTVATYTADEDELRKRITSLALAGDRLVLFDNLEGKFGNGTLDAALTATSWEDRILGINRMFRGPLHITWYATGNNVALGGDTARRACHIRLESPEERPEERTGFRHPQLLAWVGQHRLDLLGAALTILRAYCVAGRPSQELTAWGSFEGWSDLVRSAVVWVGCPDPGTSRRPLQDQADTRAQGMTTLLACWEKMDPHRRGLTAAQVMAQLFTDPPAAPPDYHADMRATLEALLDKPDSRALGNLLRSCRRRLFGGRFIDSPGTQQNAARWAVYPAQAFRHGRNNTHQTHDSHPHDSPGPAGPRESGESGECFSPDDPDPGADHYVPRT